MVATLKRSKTRDNRMMQHRPNVTDSPEVTNNVRWKPLLPVMHCAITAFVPTSITSGTWRAGVINQTGQSPLWQLNTPHVVCTALIPQTYGGAVLMANSDALIALPQITISTDDSLDNDEPPQPVAYDQTAGAAGHAPVLSDSGSLPTEDGICSVCIENDILAILQKDIANANRLPAGSPSQVLARSGALSASS